MDNDKTIGRMLENIIQTDSHFAVFPSDLPCRFNTIRLASTKLQPIDTNKCIAWDEFKKRTLSSHESEKQVATDAIRRLFCAEILSQNAENPVFGDILPPEFASNWLPFINSLADTLPLLNELFTVTPAYKEEKSATWYQDLQVIYTKYSGFLQQYGFYEPAWSRKSFDDTDCEWHLFFPELADDWSLYKQELEAHPKVHIISIEQVLPEICEQTEIVTHIESIHGKLILFPEVTQEIRWAARFIRYLIDTFELDNSELLISIPDAENWAEPIEHEFKLFDIPLSVQIRKPLSSYPGGRLFERLYNLPASLWSFKALSDLLLDHSIHWKEPLTVNALIQFGMDQRCVSGYEHEGKHIDIWEESFKRFSLSSTIADVSLREIRTFYRSFSASIRDILTSKDFISLRNSFQTFKSRFIDEGALDSRTDSIISRCLQELEELIHIQEKLADLSISSPFRFFLYHIQHIPYVFQNTTETLKAYNYRVGAGTNPLIHLVMNMTQEAASVRTKPFPFLREDRRKKLRVEDEDRSRQFIEAYTRSGSFTIFTASRSGFNGHSSPHTFFAEGDKILQPSIVEEFSVPDPYAYEETRIDSPTNLHVSSMQLCGITRLRTVLDMHKKTDYRRDSIENPAILDGIITRVCKDTATPRISPTDINTWIGCPLQWLFGKGLRIREEQADIESVDQRDVGILYHKILEQLFKRIKLADPRIRENHLPQYLDWLVQECDSVMNTYRTQEGAFQEFVFDALRPRILASLASLLEKTIPLFDSAAILGVEYPLEEDCGDLILFGTADLILQKNDSALIIDYKTGKTPAIKDLFPEDSAMTTNYQMAAYIRMTEHAFGIPVHDASFYSIDNRKPQAVLHPEGPSGKSRLPVERAEYQSVLEQLDIVLENIIASLRSGSFPIPAPENRAICASCTYRAVCRSSYAGEDL